MGRGGRGVRLNLNLGCMVKDTHSPVLFVAREDTGNRVPMPPSMHRYAGRTTCHVNRAATSPTEIPLAALGPGVRSLTALTGAHPVVGDGRVVLPGDGPAAFVAAVD